MRLLASGAVLAVLTTGLQGLAQPLGIPPPSIAGRALTDRALAASAVAPLIAQLGSPDYRAREKAGRDLLALGDRALPALKAALPTVEDPEANRRLQVIVAKLDGDRLRSPRRVTLKVTDKSPKEIVTEIARQSGYVIRCDDEGHPKVRLSFDLAGVPFWEALDKVCDAAGLIVSEQGEDGSLAVYYNDTYNPHVCYDGPFKVVATNVNSGRGLQLAGLSRRQPNPRQPEYLNLNLSLLSEPKAAVVGIGTPVVTKAVDDRGGSLAPPPDGSPAGLHDSLYLGAAPAFRSFNTNFGLSLVRPDRAAESVKELRGKVPVMLLAEVRPEITVPDLLKVRKKRFAGRTVELDVITADFQNDVLTLDLTFRRRGGDPDDYGWLNTLAVRTEVLDAAGAKLRFNGVNNQNNGPGVCGMQLQFTTQGGATKAGKPATLQFVEWVTVTRDVNFVLKDLPLP